MKNKILKTLFLPFLLVSCSLDKNITITETTFFLVMTNIQYYPEEYVDKNLTLDCFTYSLEDVNGERYLCGVRRCTAGFGCKCGKDTVIGFILNYESGEIPEPKNQYENNADKTWIHISGQLDSTVKEEIEIYSYDQQGEVTSNTEKVQFLSFNISSLEEISDYSNLAYFVSK